MPEAIPTDAIRDVTDVTEVAVSPDGGRVAFVATEFDAEEDERYTALFTVPADGGEPPHRMTRVAVASGPAWSPDGSQLAFLAPREEDLERKVTPGADEDEEDDETDDEDDSVDNEDESDDNGDDSDDGNGSNGPGNDEPENQVWVFDLERGGDARQVTDREYGVREFDWGPDGERLVIAARDPTDEEAEYLEAREEDGPIEVERLQHKVNGVGFTDDVTTYLFVVDVETGEERRLDDAYGAGAFGAISGLQPTWNPESEAIAYITCLADRPDDTTESDVVLVDAETGEVTRLTDGGLSTGSLSWSPDGTKLTFSGRDADNWYLPADAFVAEPERGSVTCLTEETEATVSWFGAPTFLDDDTVLAGLGEAGHTRLFRLSASGDEIEPLTLGASEDRSARFLDVAGGTVAYSSTGPSHGHDLYAIDGDAILDGADEDGSDGSENDPATRLTELNRELLDEHSMPNVRRLATDNDGVTVESILYYPESFDPDDPDPHPLIVWSHGGPMSYDDPEFAFSFAYYTSRGYLVCKPNYRGSTSYGIDFADTLHGRWGTVEVDDVLAVTDDLVDRGYADDERLFATGFSYGGIMTGFLITQSDRFTAAAAEHGIYDLRSDFGAGDSHIWMGNEFGLPWEEPEAYTAGSSITDVGNATTPTLVTAGGQDWRCPPHQSEQLYVSLKKQGVPAKLVVYPNEHHEVRKPERAIHRLETIVEWFEEHDPATE